MDFQIDNATDNIETSGETESGSPGRITPARQTVLQILKATHLALTHHEIEQQAKAKGVQFDRVTLYRALEWLVTKALANKVAAEDRIWRFSAARDGSQDQAYFHCTTCGEVTCLESASSSAPVLPAGFRVRRSEVMLRGECGRATCAK
jgi:Fur family transcriptional regulator, ferric uptake regulator